VVENFDECHEFFSVSSIIHKIEDNVRYTDYDADNILLCCDSLLVVLFG